MAARYTCNKKRNVSQSSEPKKAYDFSDVVGRTACTTDRGANGMPEVRYVAQNRDGLIAGRGWPAKTGGVAPGNTPQSASHDAVSSVHDFTLIIIDRDHAN